MPAYTPLGIPYPSDYADPADTPAVMEAGAVVTDGLIAERAKVYVQSAQPSSPQVGDIWCPV